MEIRHFNITWGGLWKIFFMLLLIWVLFLALDIVLALLMAVIVSLALDPAVTWLESRRVPRILGTLIVYIAILLLFALVVYLIVPVALTELSNLISVLNQQLDSDILASLNIDRGLEAINQVITNISNLVVDGSRSLFDLTSRIFGGLVLAGSVFVLSFYLTVGKDGTKKFLADVLPAVYEKRVVDLYDRVYFKIGRWFQGQLLLSLSVGLLVFLALELLGVKYSLILGIVAAIIELIPYVGPIFSGALSIGVALTQSLSLGLYVLIAFIIIQQLENQIFVPVVHHLTVDLNPVVALVALLIGAQVFGFIGLVLAIPVAVLLQEIMESWSENRRRDKSPTT